MSFLGVLVWLVVSYLVGYCSGFSFFVDPFLIWFLVSVIVTGLSVGRVCCCSCLRKVLLIFKAGVLLDVYLLTLCW